MSRQSSRTTEIRTGRAASVMVLCCLLIEFATGIQWCTAAELSLKQGDVVAFLGGTDVASAQRTGHLEALLAANYSGLGIRFRNFGWEGDTVFEQPRDVGFPPLTNHLQRAGATVLILEYGRAECAEGVGGIARFTSAYGRLLDDCVKVTTRMVLVTPPPFEKGIGSLPDLSSRNASLGEFAGAIRQLAQQRHLPLVDLFSELGGAAHQTPRLTDDGFQLSSRGQALVAHAFAKQVGLQGLAERTGEADEKGVWSEPLFERLRQTVTAKNVLWFDYWRPQNWAFLGGDRISQPSSRDHRDPKVRWFPAEMEKFVPLIEAKEREIEVAARRTGGGR